MKDLEQIKYSLRLSLSEETVDAIEVLIELKMAEMLEELSRRLEVKIKS